MKKLLLAAVALLFAVGVSAQDFNLRATSAMKSMPVSTPPSKLISTKNFDALSIVRKAPKTVMKAAEMPEGEQHEYFIQRFDAVGGVTDTTGYAFNRVTKETVVYGNDGTVYIPNFLAGSYLDEPGWIEGTLSADKTSITVKQNQVLGSYEGVNMILVAYGDDGYLMQGDITFTIDSDYGIIMMQGGGLMMGYTYGTMFYYMTQCSSVRMYPTDNRELFAEPVTRKVTAQMISGSNPNPTAVTYDVEDVESNLMRLHYIKGLLSQYPDSWFIAVNNDASETQLSNDLVVYGQAIDNDIMAVVYNESNMSAAPDVIVQTQTVFTYNPDGSYTMAQGDIIADYGAVGYNQFTGMYEFGNSCLYTDIKLGAPTPSGISSVTTDKEPVATEYYDLSGRRVDAAAKGVTIRVEKYADGTRKAVKTIK